MKIDRLISIIMILLEKEKISASVLAKMFEVSTRTIYRDLETINAAGIPVVTYTGVKGGVGIMERYKVDKKLFTLNDITSLLTGLGTISSAVTDKDLLNTLAKVKSLIPAEHTRKIDLKVNQIAIDLRSWAGNKTLHADFEKIKKALDEKKYLLFHYYDGKGQKSSRKVEPYQLVLKETHWYLQGYCTEREDYRIFKLVRMGSLTVSDEEFAPRDFIPKPLNGAGWIDKKIITIKLLVDKSLREQISERCGEKNIKRADNNKLLVDFPFVEDDMGYSLLLSYGHKCECLAPENVRKELTRRLHKMISLYKK